MPLGTEKGLYPGDIVLDGDPATPTERGTAAPPLFGPCLLWPNGRPSRQLLSSCLRWFVIVSMCVNKYTVYTQIKLFTYLLAFACLLTISRRMWITETRDNA